jgi:hypothetical protein
MHVFKVDDTLTVVNEGDELTGSATLPDGRLGHVVGVLGVGNPCQCIV